MPYKAFHHTEGFELVFSAMSAGPQPGSAQRFDTDTVKQEDGGEGSRQVILPLPPRLPETGGNFLFASDVQTRGRAVNDDAQLIAETLAGRSTAFGQLVEKYQDRLYNTMVHIVGSRDDARDVVQDAFVQAFLKLETFQQNCAFYTWLYRIAFNAAASLSRRKRPAVSVEEVRDSFGREPVDKGAGPSEQMEEEERRRYVQAAIAALPEEFRTVLVLREMEGYCYEEIAEILELPVGTVRSRLHRARLQLRQSLKQVLAIED